MTFPRLRTVNMKDNGLTMHVIQEHQYIDGKPVFYSIGNLVFDKPNPETHEGILLEMRIIADTSTVNALPYHADNGKPMIQ